MISDYGAMRTHGAGTLGAADIATTVTLGGWIDARRDHGGVAFLDLRDRTGVVQVVVGDRAAHDLRNEFVILVTGEVRARPDDMVNPKLATGEIEVVASELEILARAEPPPFPVEDGVEVGEDVRLKYRYIDLRRSEMAATLRARAAVNTVIRNVMERHGFLEVETPVLTRPTPEGARDFLVPSRLQQGSSYALPQSPQLFKQLLQVAGVERYYQIARCFRDEDLRADRQPEFTQLDVEMSFGDEEDVISLIEELLAEVWRQVAGVDIPTPFPRIDYFDAMRRYGSDKPDLRFEMELADLTEAFAETGVVVFRGAVGDGGSVIALALSAPVTRKQFDEWIDWAKARGAKGLAWAVVEDDSTLRSPLAKFMTEDEIAAILAIAQPGDAIFFGAGRDVHELMGALRVALAHEHGLIDESRWQFVWVSPMALFVPTDDGWTPGNHPFTSPADESWETDPRSAKARAYDVVLNGYELGGGSIRVHDPDTQRRLLAFLGIDESRFEFLLRGLAHGAPPHGGIALGVDRIVMLVQGLSSIRDVIAFPKTQSGACLLTDAPADNDPAALAELGLRAASTQRLP